LEVRSLKIVLLTCIAGSAVFLAGCATVYYPEATPGMVEWGKGVYHVVEKGQTLWRISQVYGVDLDEIAAVNSITDASEIQKGQKVFIPGASRVMTAESVQKDFAGDEFVWPAKGSVLSYFHRGGEGVWQQGIRVRVDSQAQIFSSRQGKVVFADELMGHGETVIIDHQDGFITVYGNNAQLAVDLGDTVAKNDMIAVSPSGEKSFLYFEIRRNGMAANPLLYLPKI